MNFRLTPLAVLGLTLSLAGLGTLAFATQLMRDGEPEAPLMRALENERSASGAPGAASAIKLEAAAKALAPRAD